MQSTSKSKRALRPRHTAALVVSPIVVSDLSAAAVVGLEPRQFRELVRAKAIPHTLSGQRMLVRAEDLLAALDVAPAAAEPLSEAPAVDDHDLDDDEPKDADEVLRRIGLERRR